MVGSKGRSPAARIASVVLKAKAFPDTGSRYQRDVGAVDEVIFDLLTRTSNYQLQ
jgi:hypothetical protein